MNKSFMKTKELVLDENYKIIPDSDNGVILIYIGEPKENKKGELVENKTEYCYPRISQALRKYVDKNLNSQERFGLLISKLDDLHKKIDLIDETFKQF